MIMKLKIGDKVRYLNEVGEGIVTKIIDSKTVEIEDETGFEVPVLESELVLIDRNEKKLLNIDNNEDFSDNEDEDSGDNENDEIDLSFLDEPATPELKNNDIAIELAIVNDNGIFNFYVINQSSYAVYCNIISNENEKYKNLSNFYLNNDSRKIFHSANPKELLDKYNLIFQILFISKETDELQSPIETTVSISAVQIIKESSYKSNNYFREKAIIREIYSYGLKSEIEKISEKELQKIIRQKQESERIQKQLSQKYKAKAKPELVEIDLHIQNLLDNYTGMSNTEMLLYQMDVFHKEMKKAIENKVHKIVFIHGVGNGTLKHEIRKSLTQDYPKYRFQDASFAEYGFGATLVYL